jgi:hypothetical protein
MKRTLLLCLCLAAAPVLGCGAPPGSRYQAVSAGEDKVYRLDTETGEMVYVVGSHGVPVDLPAALDKKDKK